MKARISIFVFSLILGGFLFFNYATVQAQCACSTSSRTERWCEPAGACGGEIWAKTYWRTCCVCIGPEGGAYHCADGVTGPFLAKKCSIYQRCINGTCVCKGSCFPSPYLISVEDVEQNVFDSSDRVKLPVKLDWEDLNVSPCRVGSYHYVIVDNNSKEVIEGYAGGSSVEITGCRLKSNKSYTWRVQACLSSDGSDCGVWSEPQSFNTSQSPELISPYDPDWQIASSTGEAEVPITLDWCDVKEADFYQLRVYLVEDDEETCHPWMETAEGCKPLLLLPSGVTGEPSSQFIDDQGYFAKDSEYKWEVSTYYEKEGSNYSFFSQMWGFKTVGDIPDYFGLLYPSNDPSGAEPVGLPVTLQWTVKHGINSVNYEITPLTGGAAIKGVTTASEIGLDCPKLSLNSFYRWKVQPCSDFQGKDCEPDYTEEWYFKTTGQAPKLIYPSAGADNVPIPIELDWQDVPGAKSYVLKIQGGGLNLEETVNESKLSLTYPEFNLRQQTSYSWQVKTCAWEDGEAYGSYSSLQNFTTFKLPPPAKPFPENNGVLYTNENIISWGKVSGAQAYQYKMKYLSLIEEETDEICSMSVGQQLVPQKKVLSNGDSISLICLGKYQWQVRACLDEACQETGEWSNWFFSSLEPSQARHEKGLVPCGRITNDPDTPWNEREPCETRHIFLMIKVIIDFILFRVIPAVVVLMVLLTGLMFYLSTSTGSPDPIVRVKALWRSVIIGLGITFFAWMLVNIFLKVIGYQMSIFGNWYSI